MNDEKVKINEVNHVVNEVNCLLKCVVCFNRYSRDCKPLHLPCNFFT